MKKLIVIGIIILLTSMSIPSTGIIVHKSTASFNGNTLYVGGIGPGNYTKIQDAIDNTSKGDTVYVYNGTYNENIEVNKSLVLEGENKNITIIDGGKNGSVILITSDNVVIRGFCIQNSGILGFVTGGIESNSNYNIIEKNILINNDYGIFLVDSSNNRINDNNITENFLGICLLQSKNNIVANNILTSNDWDGIASLQSSNNKVARNIISENGANGIYISESFYNNITDNHISHSFTGISLSFYSCYNIISENVITESEYYGILLFLSSNHTVVKNTITQNKYGIYLSNSSYNEIISNIFIKNKLNAFFEDCTNLWSQNYWNRPRFMPKFIIGKTKIHFLPIPWFNVDWHPAKEPMT